MNPITIAGGIAAVALLAYTCNSFYEAGQSSVQVEWDRAVLAWQEEKSALQTKVSDFERELNQSQKEIQNAREAERRQARELAMVQKTRADTAVAGLRDAATEFAKRVNPKSDDSAALTECKTTARTYQGLHDACVGRYRELAEAAKFDLDSARDRGLECQATYDAAEQALKNFGARKKPD